ncbi:DEAD/DEAH box helicase [Cupriavidus sp. AcVe19-1a]|uniref:DEAD/DEAH box helicase n=1 Tax=Cupriavidus sp. AcVe19-1a TaxID=2821359 RepID=UPI001AE708FE|nr:DEAD/DEAH box helicase [Cupriavidus sp. AcVe19-1a]MBP0633495.1 DEAD/DEAH box helicase family protein [Cupriavidus sp. AcVe19-1a]
MFNFKSLSSTAKSDAPATLAELFGQLDRKATHISLRPVQLSALARLDEQSAKHDVVIKLSTGSGKTVVGLVYAELMRRRHKGDPVLYLCPTTQLVDQVVQSANAIGVPVSTFPPKGLPYEALAGDTVLICTYDRLFNARNVFETNTVRPSCIVLDDVHAGVDRVRACYTIRVPDECFEQFRAMLQPLCEASDPATWRGISNNEADAKYEVPYWIWANIHTEVGRLLEPYKDQGDLLFRWGNFSRYMDLARACISGQGAEISLPLSAVEENACYSNAKHRLFMSASIKDGSTFIADLDCDAEAFQRVIEPPEDEGAGERMMLATSLISHEASKQDIANVCKDLARHTNVVVLTSSAAQAKTWVDAGATLKQGKDVDTAIEALRASTGNYIVFAQRFDGVDLPDDACRVLVLDGVPAGDRLCDKIDASRQKDSPEYDVRTVNKFEQALGRAVRSSADYAAVLLVGQDIAAFIGKRSVRELLETRSRVQVDLGKDLVKLTPGQPLRDAISGMVQALLTRNEEWKEAHRNRVKGAEKITRQGASLTVHERIANAVRASWKLAKSRNFQAAVPILREAANDGALHDIQKAELLYRIASYLHQVDPSAAADAYRAAFEINPDFPRPEKLADKKFVRLNDQAVAARDYFGKFAQANAAIARLDEIAAKLSFGMPADTVEQGLLELGQALAGC